MKTIKSVTVVVLLFFHTILAAAEFTGTVINFQSKKPIPAVNIYIKNSTVGTTTDTNGRFVLTTSSNDGIVIFEHIAFEKIEKPLAELVSNSVIELLPIVIQTQEISIETDYEPARIVRDIPQTYKVLKSSSFETRGYMDAGDFLKTEQSIQIQEEFSGRKTISMRGGNADDVVVLYNGIKLNNVYDNTFDLSLLNLDDVQQIELVKGNNSSLYGSKGFSGIINIIPKTERDYYLKFQQRFGSWNSGAWNAQVNYTFFDRLNLSYTQKRSGSQRRYADSPRNDEFLENKVLHHSANLSYSVGNEPGKNIFNMMYFYTKSDYENTRYYESLDNINEMAGTSYNGDIGFIKRLHVVGAWQKYDANQFVWSDPDYVDRQADNQSFSFSIDKRILYRDADFLVGYQLEDASLDFIDERDVTADIPLGIEEAEMAQMRQGFISIAKLYAPSNSQPITHSDFSVSYRYDIVDNMINHSTLREGYKNDDLNINMAPLGDKRWTYSTIKFSTHLGGKIDDFSAEAFFNNGANVKFPSLFQQMSTPLAFGSNAAHISPSLSPEKNNSMEIGFQVRRDILHLSNVNSWQININYFVNNYENKFRMYYLNGIPMAFYDNVQTARISGIELTTSSLLFDKKISLETGVSKYNVSSKSAFPFKSDFLVICNLDYMFQRFALKFHWFFENEQAAWMRNAENSFYEIKLPGHSNIDIHLSRSFQIVGFTPYLDVSVRNLLHDDTSIEGLAIRDRRIYLTFGIQY